MSSKKNSSSEKKMSFKKTYVIKKKMAKEFKISTEEFDRLLEEQKPDTLKWSDLEEGAIYRIEDTKMVNTVHGESCIITLAGGEEVWSPSALTRRLETEEPPLLVRPKGKAKSKKTGNEYYDFDLVKPRE